MIIERYIYWHCVKIPTRSQSVGPYKTVSRLFNFTCLPLGAVSTLFVNNSSNNVRPFVTILCGLCSVIESPSFIGLIGTTIIDIQLSEPHFGLDLYPIYFVFFSFG